MTQEHHEDTTSQMAWVRARVTQQVEKVVVGQSHVVDATLIAIAVGGHLLLEGPPGVAKSLLASALGHACRLESHRVQFTPDMLPSDLTGTLTLRGGELGFRPGPVFTNILLADEINRTPPKTQAALLEAMQEGQVTVDGVEHPLPEPFTVLATQNPIEYKGTYPLPEAQLDRFLMKVVVSYPAPREEEALLKLRRFGVAPVTLGDVEAVAETQDLLAMRRQVDRVSVSDEMYAYVASLVRRTREAERRPRRQPACWGPPPRPGAGPGDDERARLCRAQTTSSPWPVLCSPTACCSPPRPSSTDSGAADALSNVLASVPIPR